MKENNNKNDDENIINNKMIKKSRISIPKYSLSEELINAISHGIGAAFAIAALVLMIIKAATTGSPLKIVTITIYGTTLIVLYVISCIYHSLSPKVKGKKVLRVLDHCNVYMLVLGTYIPVSLIGVGGTLGWILFGIVCFVTTLGIIFTSINIDKFQVISVICHLVNGWSIVFGITYLINNIGINGVLYTILGGVLYSVGALLYGIGSKVKYMHCVFHFFCLFASLSHFIAIYFYII